MILSGILLLWITTWGSIKATQIFTQLNKKVCVQVTGRLERFVGNIKVGATDFKDLARNSQMLVDKSLLIKSILESESLVSLTYPSKWGKTMNLDMMKIFFELQVDEEGKIVPLEDTWGYRYFVHGEVGFDDGHIVMLKKPPLISLHSDIVAKHLGKYPVLRIDLSSLKPTSDSLEGFFNGLRLIIQKVYKKHEYLVEYLRTTIGDMSITQKERTIAKERLKKLKKYLTVSYADEELEQSLQFLSVILFERFGKKVFIMIDNYDEVVRKTVLSQSKYEIADVEKLLDFYSKFINTTMRTNENLYKSVVTGMLNIDSCLIPSSSASNGFANYNVLRRNIRPFYGFTESEVKQLFSQIRLDKSLVENASLWYCGFRMGDFLETVICNPWSIVNFVNTKKLKSFWCGMEKFEIFPNLMSDSRIRTFIQRIMSKCVDANIEYDILNLNRSNIASLKSIWKEKMDHVTLTWHNVTLIFGLYCATGYFSLDVDAVHLPSDNAPRLKIPCQEVDIFIMEEMSNYYRIRYGSEVCNLAAKAADRFVESLDFKPGTQSKLLYSLKSLYQTHSCRDELFDYEVMDYFHFVVLLYVKRNYGFNIGHLVWYYDKDMKYRRVFMTFYGKNYGLLFNYYLYSYWDNLPEVTVMTDKANEVYEWQSFFQNKCIKTIQFVFVAYHGKQNVIGALMLNQKYPSVSSNANNDSGALHSWSQFLDDFKNFKKT